MACGSNCPCCKKKAKKRVTKKKTAVPRPPPHRMVNINVVPPVGEGAPRWKKDLVSVDSIGGKVEPVKPIKTYATTGTQTEAILKEEVKAPRPAKYIRKPVTPSTPMPKETIVEPPSRFARHFAEMERRKGYTEIKPPRTAEIAIQVRPRTAEIETQTEEAPEKTRVTKQFKVVPEERGRPVIERDPYQKLISEMFKRG